MEDNSLKECFEFVDRENLMSLAVIEHGAPWIANVFYMCDCDHNLVFLSGKSTRHSKVIHEGSPVAVAIYNSKSEFGEVEGVQMFGEVKEISLAEGAKYVMKFSKYFNTDLEVDLKEVMGSRFYKFIPVSVVYRNTKRFKGKKEFDLLEK